jgi:hypothetical protein
VDGELIPVVDLKTERLFVEDSLRHLTEPLTPR